MCTLFGYKVSEAAGRGRNEFLSKSIVLFSISIEMHQHLTEWSLPRSIKSTAYTDLQLHGFSGASMKAYGTCIYIRSANHLEYQYVLLCSKLRVAPVKTISLPRLELCGAVLLVKLVKTVQSSLKMRFNKMTLRSDSTIALNWIETEPYRLSTFEANHISEIQGITRPQDWKYFPTKENPADAISRGQVPEDFLSNHLWKTGPPWLIQPENTWPDYQLEGIKTSEIQQKMLMTCFLNIKWCIWKRYSSLT